MKLQKELENLIKSQGITQALVSKSIGISEQILSAWLKGNYKGDNDTVDKAVKSYLAKDYEIRTAEPFKIPFISTSVVNRVFKVARTCHLHSKIGVCFGEAGLGKTTAIKEYIKNNPDTVLIEVEQGYTKKIFIQELHKALGFDGGNTFHYMRNDITKRLKNSGRLVIVDETEKLNHTALDTLRRIHDKTDYTFGILLIGTPELYHNLRGRKGEYQYLSSRILHNTELDVLSENDVEKIVLEVFPEANNLVDIFYQCSKGKTRFLCNLLELLEIKKRETLCEINKKLIIDVAAYMANFY